MKISNLYFQMSLGAVLRLDRSIEKLTTSSNDEAPAEIIHDPFLINSWRTNKISYRIEYLTNNMNISTSDQHHALLAALNVWESNTDLQFHETSKKDAKILVQFHQGIHGDGFDFDGRGHTLAHAFYPGQGLRSGQVHFDGEENWSIYGYNTGETSLLMVALHEIGHALGLGHSLSSDSVMRPIYKGYSQSTLQLGEDDKEAISKLYGKKRYQLSNLDERRMPIFEDVDLCGNSWDAVMLCREETFFFSDRRMWRLNNKGELLEPLAMRIHEFWNGFPRNKNLDAAYERTSDGAILFFVGQEIYKFNGTNLATGYPKNISEEFNLPSHIPIPKRIDTAIHWRDDQLTFIFHGNNFWKIDEYNYPGTAITSKLNFVGTIRESMWHYLPEKLDAAFIDLKDITHFIKGRKTWQFNRMELKSALEYEIVGEKWFKCPIDERQVRKKEQTRSILNWFGTSSTENCRDFLSLFVFFVFLI